MAEQLNLNLPDQRPPMDEYAQRREREARRQANMSASGRDIGDIEPVANPERREACRTDFLQFCKTYFAEIFYLAFGEFHIKTARRMQAAILHGQRFALAMPRGSGKSALCECAVLWATLYGYRHFPVIIAASDNLAKKIFGTIKKALLFNPKIKEDFPEVCQPIAALENITNRCKGQTQHGIPTDIGWGDEIVFACVKESKVGGTIIMKASMTASIRGLKYATPDGREVRPDMVVVDDPQTKESAKSAMQVKDRLELINSDIAGMAGPEENMTIFVPCTVIQRGDVADQLLDRELNPIWQGIRYQLLDGFPTNLPLWQRYWNIRMEALRNDRGVEDSNRFYIENRQTMDDGCSATWPERFKPNEVSAIQSAMNLYFTNKSTFMSEYQNTPAEDDPGNEERLRPEDVFKLMNRRPKMQVPQAATHATMFIDVQKNLLYWAVMAFADDFTSWLLDYGAFPDQPRQMFTTYDASPTYSDICPAGTGLEGALTNALDTLIPPWINKPLVREDGAELYIERCMIDAGWGDSTDAIYTYIRESGLASILMPSKGVGITPAVRPFSEYQRRLGETVSQYEWHVAPVKNRPQIRLMRFDANWWKTFFRNRAMTARGDRGGFSVNESALSDRLRMLADHLTSEYPVSMSIAGGRRCDVWKLPPNKENHWLDCVVGCMVAASERGCKLLIDPPTARGKEPKPSANPHVSRQAAKRQAQAGQPRVIGVGRSIGAVRSIGAK
jgi:hypothetical protein